jgi:hypothetical protein
MRRPGGMVVQTAAADAVLLFVQVAVVQGRVAGCADAVVRRLAGVGTALGRPEEPALAVPRLAHVAVVVLGGLVKPGQSGARELRALSESCVRACVDAPMGCADPGHRQKAQDTQARYLASRWAGGPAPAAHTQAPAMLSLLQAAPPPGQASHTGQLRSRHAPAPTAAPRAGQGSQQAKRSTMRLGGAANLLNRLCSSPGAGRVPNGPAQRLL